MYSVSERYIPGTVNKLLNQLSVKGLFIAFYSDLSVLRYGTEEKKAEQISTIIITEQEVILTRRQYWWCSRWPRI